MKRGRILFIFALFMVPGSSRADLEGILYSYKEESPDKRFVFVQFREEHRERPSPEHLRLSKEYPKSGLYRNDGSTIPLWTVDWSGRDADGSVILSSDGIHMVREGPWARGPEEEAVTFFSRGKELQSYCVSDLVTFPFLLPHTISHLFWRKRIDIDERKSTLVVTTLHAESYVFDLETGFVDGIIRPAQIDLA